MYFSPHSILLRNLDIFIILFNFRAAAITRQSAALYTNPHSEPERMAFCCWRHVVIKLQMLKCWVPMRMAREMCVG